MMWWDNSSWGHGWWPVLLVMGVLMVICMVMMARMMRHAMPGSHTRDSERHGSDVPERILAQRLASGEIDTDEYERLCNALQRPADSARTK